MNKYYLAILPSEEISEKVAELKCTFKEKFNSKPSEGVTHLTLFPPFKMDAKYEEDFVRQFQDDIGSECLNIGDLFLDGLGTFPQGVVFVSVAKTGMIKHYYQIAKEFCLSFEGLDAYTYVDREYNPHITIGFSSEEHDNFQQVKDYAGSKDFKDKFLMDRIVLLRKQKGEAKYKVVHEFLV